MPHDKHGKQIEVGDFVKAKPYNYGERKPGESGCVPVVGRVVQMREGQSCSGDFAWLSPWSGLKFDAFGADEAELVLKKDGSEA